VSLTRSEAWLAFNSSKRSQSLRRAAGPVWSSPATLLGMGPDGKAEGAAPQATRPPAEKGAKQSKLAAFWEAIKERPSWKKVYEAGLH
jgi:hypothetical protein